MSRLKCGRKELECLCTRGETLGQPNHFVTGSLAKRAKGYSITPHILWSVWTSSHDGDRHKIWPSPLVSIRKGTAGHIWARKKNVCEKKALNICFKNVNNIYILQCNCRRKDIEKLLYGLLQFVWWRIFFLMVFSAGINGHLGVHIPCASLVSIG